MNETDKFNVDDAIKLLKNVDYSVPNNSATARAAIIVGVAIMIAGSSVAHAIREAKAKEG
jgi:hypothetical protein